MGTTHLRQKPDLPKPWSAIIRPTWLRAEEKSPERYSWTEQEKKAWSRYSIC
jgi:hypothetical protein